VRPRIARALLELMPNLYSNDGMRAAMAKIAKDISPPNTEESVILELVELLWASHSPPQLGARPQYLTANPYPLLCRIAWNACARTR